LITLSKIQILQVIVFKVPKLYNPNWVLPYASQLQPIRSTVIVK
jgi:hypothetical protein